MAILNAGSGKDGDAIVTAGNSINLSTSSLVGRSYPDMSCYQVSSLGPTSCTINDSTDGLEAGDVVLLYCHQSFTGDVTNVGNWEYLEISSIVGSTVSFSTPKNRFYGNTGEDSVIGTSGSTTRVTITRVPQYTNLTIQPTAQIAGSGWGGSRYGLMCLMVSGKLTNNGTISMNESGYRGGRRTSDDGEHGESLSGFNNQYGGGERHAYGGSVKRAGAGAHAEDGLTGEWGGTDGGSAYGTTNLSNKIFMGSGGGSSEYGDLGGNGGGIIIILTTEIDSTGGIITTKGQNAGSRGGDGAGGAILVRGGIVKFTNIVQANSFQPDTYGDGYIRVEYAALTGDFSAFNPTPSTDNSLQLPYQLSGTLTTAGEIRVYSSSWVLLKNQSFSAGTWEIGNLPSGGPFYIIAVPNDSSENILGYKGVMAVQ